MKVAWNKRFNMFCCMFLSFKKQASYFEAKSPCIHHGWWTWNYPADIAKCFSWVGWPSDTSRRPLKSLEESRNVRVWQAKISSDFRGRQACDDQCKPLIQHQRDGKGLQHQEDDCLIILYIKMSVSNSRLWQKWKACPPSSARNGWRDARNCWTGWTEICYRFSFSLMTRPSWWVSSAINVHCDT